MRRLFVGLVCVLIGVGVQMVHSASLTSSPGRAEAIACLKKSVALDNASDWQVRRV